MVSAPQNLNRAALCQNLSLVSLPLGRAFEIPAEGLSLAPPWGESLLGAVPGGAVCREQGWGHPEQGNLDLPEWQLCQREGRPPKAVPSPPTPDPKRAPGLELEAGSCQASHFPSLSLFPFCTLMLMGGSEDNASLMKVPGYGHWGGVMGVQKGWRGARQKAGAGEGQELFWAPLPPRTMHPSSDGKRPSCLPGKDVSCAGRSQAEPAGCPPQALPRSLCFAATLGPSPAQPTRLPLHPSTVPSLQPQFPCAPTKSEHPDLMRLGRSINNINQVRPGTC